MTVYSTHSVMIVTCIYMYMLVVCFMVNSIIVIYTCIYLQSLMHFAVEGIHMNMPSEDNQQENQVLVCLSIHLDMYMCICIAYYDPAS